MKPSQLRHAQSMARHILTHVQQIEREMKAIERTKFSEVADLPVSVLTKWFTDDLQVDMQNIYQVVSDMLPELEDE